MINKGQLNTILVRIVALYALATALWIFSSEFLAHNLIHDLALLNRVTMIKGLLYVVVSSGMLYFLLQYYVARILQGTARLRESEARYSTLIENARDGIFIQTGGRFAYLNTSACAMFGVQSPDELIGAKVIERFHPYYRDKVLERIRIINEERRPVSTMDEKCLRMDGTAFDVDLQAVPFDYKGEKGALAFFRDISQRKQDEADKEKNREFLAAILDCIEDGVVACDRDGALTLFNRSSRRIYGINDESIQPECWSEYYELFEPDGETRIRREDGSLHMALRGVEVTNREVIVKPKDGPPVTLLATGRQLVEQSGRRLGAVVSLHDITKVKTLEENLRQSQRMESIGTLAGGVAHDFNNIITVIMGCCTMLTMKLENDPALEPFVRQIIDSSERAAKLTHSLLAFSRKQAIKLLPADINDIVLRMKDFLERIIGEDVRLETVLGTEPLLVSVDRGQIEQVLMNLAVNARDAMPDGGILRIETSLADTGGMSMGLDDCRSARCVLITVKDTGIGMDRAVREKIYEPFFTTKEPGRGTGLGLSMAYGIIKQHEGTIKVRSEPGRGAEFLIYLPARETRRDVAAEKQELPLPAGKETLLLVEDDDAVRELNGNILSSVGYHVVAASNGHDALELFASRLDSIALVILDVIMPGMNGKELHDRLRLIRPRVKVLFASGYSSDILLQKGFVPEDVNFISKPFAPYPFLSKVRELIDECGTF